jgi:hypothetical protein
MSDSNSTKQQLLNTDDLKKGITYVVTRGKSTEKVTATDFDILFEAKAKAMGLVSGMEAGDALKGNAYAQEAGKKLSSALDQDGDGQVTSKDFEVYFQRQMSFIDAHRSQVDQYLPLVGQCAFGIGAGWVIGRIANKIIKFKLPILIVGFGGYSGMQYLAQNNYINQTLMQQQFEQHMKQMLDVNKDGSLDRKDVEALIDKKMEIVTAKLGPGGFAPGMAGYVTFGFGLLKGLRCF